MPGRLPNVLFVYSDDTNHEMLGPPFGQRHSPRLQGLAAEGVRCSAFTTVSTVCTPSRYAWLTGHYAGRCPGPALRETAGPGEPYCITWNTRLHPERERSLGQLLQDLGYRCGWIGKNHTLPGNGGRLDLPADADPADPAVAARLAAQYAQAQAQVRACGFDEVEALYCGNPDDHPLRALQTHNLPWMAHHAAAFLDRRAADGQPFFLNVALTTLHGPHHVGAGLDADPSATPAGLRDEHLGTLPDHASIGARLRAAGVAEDHLSAGALWMDDLLGHLLDRLEANGQAADTIVIYSADHGNHRLGRCFGKSTCYHAGAHIPFVIRWPGRLPAGSVCSAPLQNVDLLPTLLAAAGAELPADVVCDGHDMLPALRGGPSPREHWFTEYGYARAIADRRYQYIAYRPPQRLVEAMRSGATPLAYDLHGRNTGGSCLQYRAYPHYWEPDQLYDLERDPEQQQNLIDEPALSGVRDELRARLRAIVDDLPDAFPLETVDPWLHSAAYRELCAATTTAVDPEGFYWYREGAY